MHLPLTPAERAAVTLAAILHGYADPETFCRAIINKTVINILDAGVSEEDDASPVLHVESSLRLFRETE